MKNITTKLKNIKPVYLVAALVMIAVAVLTPMQKQITKLFSDAAETKTYLMGDVDLNGKLEPSDARSVLRVSVQLDELEGVKDGAVLPNDKAEPTKGQLADIDGDKKITPSDARAILRMSVMLDEQKTIRVEIPEETTTVPPPIIETTTSKESEQTGYTLPPINPNASEITTHDEWQEEYDKRWQKAYEYTIAELADYKNTTFFDECQSKVDDMLIAGKSDAEIKKFVKNFKAELKQNEEPTTYWTGEHGEYCKWCGKEETVDLKTGERSCYHSSWVVDIECPGCGEFVKAYTCHDCKAYFDYMRAHTTIGEYDKPIDPDDIPDDVKYGYNSPVQWYDENGNPIIEN